MTALLKWGSVYRLLGAEGQALKDHNSERFVLSPPASAANGKNLELDVTDQLISGRLLLTMEGASTLTLQINDPGWDIEGSGILDLDEDGRMGKVDLELNGVFFRLAKANRQDPDTLTLTFEDLTVAVLREHRKPIKASRGSVTRAEFIGRMVNELPGPLQLFYSPEKEDKQPVAAPDYPTATPST